MNQSENIRDMLIASARAARMRGDIAPTVKPSPAVLAGLILEHDDPEQVMLLITSYIRESK